MADLELESIIEKLAYPEKYAPDYKSWFHGDGPAEDYFSALSDEARDILEKRRENGD